MEKAMNKKGRDSLLKGLKPKVIRLLPVLLLYGLWLSGCALPIGTSDGGDKATAWQTRILDIKIQPDTVAVGDTARITCIIQDSTDKRFQFLWGFSYGKVLQAEYDSVVHKYSSGHSNCVLWIAPNSPGLYLGNGVRVDNSTDSTPVEQGFSLHVR